MTQLLSRRPVSFVLRRIRDLTCASSFVLSSSFHQKVAHAETAAVQACIDAHATGQVARAHGRLLQARRDFNSCAVESCPQIIREDCAQFGAEVETALPSVVVAARSASGQDVAPVTVKVDASAEALPIDGRALLVDPGQHTFVVTGPNGSRASVTAFVRESEKSRIVEVRFAPATLVTGESPSAGMRRAISPLAYVLGGVGLLAAGSFTYFALDGRSREHDLRSCAPACDPAEVRGMRRSYLVSDVSLGVAVASLGLGAYLFVRPTSTTPSNHVAVGTVSLSTSPDLSAVRVLASGTF